MKDLNKFLSLSALLAFLLQAGCASQPQKTSDLKPNEALVFMKAEVVDQNGNPIPDLHCAILFGESAITRAEGGAFQKRAGIDDHSFAYFKMEPGPHTLAGISCNEGFVRTTMAYTVVAGSANYIGHLKMRMNIDRSTGTELKRIFAIGTINVGSVEYGIQDTFKPDLAEFLKLHSGFSELRGAKSVCAIQR